MTLWVDGWCNRGMTFWEGRFLMKTRDDSFLAGTIMGDADYYQKIPLVFSLICINLAFASG